MITFATLLQSAGKVGHDRLGTATWGATGRLFAICDGAGGTTGAAVTADAVTEHLVRIAPSPSAGAYSFLVDAIERMDQSSTLAAAAGMTTALVAIVADGAVQGASVGDSEAWLVSEDDDLVLTANQHRKPLVGSGRCAAVAFGPVPMHGTLVLGTDGLFKYCPRETLLRIVRTADLQVIPELLLRATQLPSGKLQDDFAVIVCQESASPLQPTLR